MKRLERLVGRWALPIVLAGLLAAWAWAAQGPQWWAQAIRTRAFIHLGLLLVGCTLALHAVLRVLVALGGRKRPRLHGDQRGLAVLEFALVFPIAMAIVLVMVQVAMLMVGNLMVHYAAFCAARSAIVWIPAYVSEDEPRNVVGGEDASQKWARIRQAAVLAVAPAAGAPQTHDSTQALTSTASIRGGVANFLTGYGSAIPGWLGKPMARKLDYAQRHTRVVIHGAPGSFGERVDVTVTVIHDFHLAIPYVARIFGRETPGESGQFSASIDASYTLVNQGKDDRVFIETVGNGNDPLLPR